MSAEDRKEFHRPDLHVAWWGKDGTWHYAIPDPNRPGAGLFWTEHQFLRKADAIKAGELALAKGNGSTSSEVSLVLQHEYNVARRTEPDCWQWVDLGQTFPLEQMQLAQNRLADIEANYNAINYRHARRLRVVKRTTTHVDEVM